MPLTLSMNGSQTGFNFIGASIGPIIGSIAEIMLTTGDERFVDPVNGVDWSVVFRTGQAVTIPDFENLNINLLNGTADFGAGRINAFLSFGSGVNEITLGDLQDMTWSELFDLGRDRLTLTSSNDLVNSGGGGDRVFAGRGDDVVIAGGGNDLVRGGGGDDALNGGAGRDRLFGENGNDTILGGGGKDAIEGGDGDDGLLGDAGNDTLLGEKGDDFLSGGGGRDHLTGGRGDDVLNGDAGNDTLIGGGGADTFIYTGGNDVVQDLFGQDTVVVDGLVTGMTVDAFLADNANVSINRAGTITLNFGDGDTLKFRASLGPDTYDVLADVLEFV